MIFWNIIISAGSSNARSAPWSPDCIIITTPDSVHSKLATWFLARTRLVYGLHDAQAIITWQILCVWYIVYYPNRLWTWKLYCYPVLATRQLNPVYQGLHLSQHLPVSEITLLIHNQAILCLMHLKHYHVNNRNGSSRIFCNARSILKSRSAPTFVEASFTSFIQLIKSLVFRDSLPRPQALQSRGK